MVGYSNRKKGRVLPPAFLRRESGAVAADAQAFRWSGSDVGHGVEGGGISASQNFKFSIYRVGWDKLGGG